MVRGAYAETRLDVAAGDWQRLDFTLNPNASDKAGRFALALKQPGSIVLGHAFLQPGEWGRFKGLPGPPRRGRGLIDQGITVLRVRRLDGQQRRLPVEEDDRAARSPAALFGHVVSRIHRTAGAFSTSWISARRPVSSTSRRSTWTKRRRTWPTSSSTPRELADSEWGRKRSRRRPSESPTSCATWNSATRSGWTRTYAAKFEALAKAIWAKDRDVILVVGDFAYGQPIRDPMNFTGAASKITSLAGHRKILALAREHGREVWFDVHIGTEGPGPSGEPQGAAVVSSTRWQRSPTGQSTRSWCSSTTPQNHAVRRALGNALATNVIERDGRLPIVTSANCLQPDGQNDNGWDQGLLFLNPSQVWLQPPGYVTQMLARNYLPQLVTCEVTGNAGQAGRRRQAQRGRQDAGSASREHRRQGGHPGRSRSTGFVPAKATAQCHDAGRAAGRREHRRASPTPSFRKRASGSTRSRRGERVTRSHRIPSRCCGLSERPKVLPEPRRLLP